MKALIAAGGSGGHVLPALYTARELEKTGCTVDFVSTKGFMSEKIQQEGFSLSLIDAKGVSFRSAGAFFSSVGAMFKALGQSVALLRKTKPDIVAGFGGYGAFPVVLIAWIFGRPTLIHEQNVLPGRANRLLSVIARKIALSFKESEEYFGKGKTVLTGCPCHMPPKFFSAEKAFQKFRLTSGKFTILVLGGSQGSRRINQDALEALSLLRRDFDFQVIHIAGFQDHDNVKEKYQKLGIASSVFDYLDTIDEAYAMCDLVISRAGAVTVSEIALFGLPAILIPYPFAGNHQIANAKILSKSKIGVIVEEKDLSPEKLKDEITAFLTDKKGSAVAGESVGGIVPANAASRIAGEILSLKS